MAKASIAKLLASDPVTPKYPQSINYRIERLSQFEWRATKLTIFTDNTILEERPFKDDAIDIVLRKLNLLMRGQAQEKYDAEKKLELQKLKSANAK